MYAISFDLDTKTLEASYPNASWQNAYDADIACFLRERGFDRQQGSVHFGDDTIDVVRCQTAVQEMTLELPRFAPSIRGIRMLRIEENNDLMPAVELATRVRPRRPRSRAPLSTLLMPANPARTPRGIE
jgi:virulence-associated protein VapD